MTLIKWEMNSTWTNAKWSTERNLLSVCLLAYNGKRHFGVTGNIFLNVSADGQEGKQCQELNNKQGGI